MKFGLSPELIVIGTDPLWVSVTLALLGVLLAITVIDLRSYRIPDVLSLPLFAAGLALALLYPDLGPVGPVFADHLIGGGAGFLLFALIGVVMFRRTGQEALGLGDAKLFGAAGAWLGWQALPMVLLISSLGGLLFALVVWRKGGGRAIAFGPWIALGFFAGWVRVFWG